MVYIAQSPADMMEYKEGGTKGFWGGGGGGWRRLLLSQLCICTYHYASIRGRLAECQDFWLTGRNRRRGGRSGTPQRFRSFIKTGALERGHQCPNAGHILGRGMSLLQRAAASLLKREESIVNETQMRLSVSGPSSAGRACRREGGQWWQAKRKVYFFRHVYLFRAFKLILHGRIWGRLPNEIISSPGVFAGIITETKKLKDHRRQTCLFNSVLQVRKWNTLKAFETSIQSLVKPH